VTGPNTPQAGFLPQLSPLRRKTHFAFAAVTVAATHNVSLADPSKKTKPPPPPGDLYKEKCAPFALAMDAPMESKELLATLEKRTSGKGFGFGTGTVVEAESTCGNATLVHFHLGM